MDCNTFQKDLELFADGELHRDQHKEAIHHFTTCSDCQKRIAQIEMTKSSIHQLWSRVNAPTALRDKITHALNEEVSTSIPLDQPHPLDQPRLGEYEMPVSGSTPALRSGFRRWFIPSTIAATILIGFIVLPGLFDRSPSVTVTVVDARSVESILDQHHMCASGGGMLHHDKSLTRNMKTIAEKLGAELGFTVLAPDFSGRGIRLIGASRCGIKGVPGSHILYRNNKGKFLSVFSVARLDGLVAKPGTGGGERHYFVSEVDTMSVIAWHEEIESNVFCAEMPRSELMGLIEGVRTAYGRIDDRSAILLAKIR